MSKSGTNRTVQACLVVLSMAMGWLLELNFAASNACGQSSSSREEIDPRGEWQAMQDIVPRHVVALRVVSPIQIDGQIEDKEWSHGCWTEEFLDIRGASLPAPLHPTRAKLLWDDTHLYIAAELMEPHLQGTIREHDAVIFQDNDFEVFIDPDGDNHRYAELELNALNTTWDLFLDRPYKDGGKADNGYEIEGLRTAVQLHGTINDPSDTDRGWTIEIAIPFASLRSISRADCPPKAGDRWRMGFSRVEWQYEAIDGGYRKTPGPPEDNWVWSPQGIIDMHRPERWGIVQFQSAEELIHATPYPELALRDALMETYHRQREYTRLHGGPAESWEVLGWAPENSNGDAMVAMPMLRDDATFRASIALVRQDGTWDVGTVTQDSELTIRNWSRPMVEALELAGSNRVELEKLLCSASDSHWESSAFLVTNMPERDLISLSAFFLQNEISLAHAALESSPWANQIPKDIFLNNILPYANINEGRESWRADFRERFAPLIEGATSPAHAAALLNQRLFPLVSVKYSTQRTKADQNPYESMKSGLASCTGLSVLLIDACRALAIPARFVGTPLWSDNSGNHSWIEVWDDGWHFTGAAEPSGNSLDQAWFIGRASTALRDEPRHAIYAVSFQKTPLSFPLVWDRSIDYVSAVNVTDRYTGLGRKPPDGTQMYSIRVLDSKTRSRVRVQVRITDDQGAEVLDGTTNDEGFDANDHLHHYLREGASYDVAFRLGPKTWNETIRCEAKPGLLTSYVPEDHALSADDESVDPINALTDYLKLEASQRPALKDQAFANVGLTLAEALRVEKLLVDDHRSRMREERRVEFDARVIALGELKMPFDFKVFGEKPPTGRSLYISMHGGGGAPARVNDSQWENQKKLYKLEEGVYVAPRAPTDTWDLWHQGHIDAMFDRLIEDMVLFEDVDPDRVFLMGYSAGGDGVYQVAPRMADRFAAASMMAGHPNETSPLSLRNLPFTIHMGAKDTAYNRNEIAKQWQGKLEDLRKADPEGYVHFVKLHEGKGHWMERQDAEALTWMQGFVRNSFPKRIVWKQDDVVEPRFYWLRVERSGLPERALVVVEADGQTIRFEHSDASAVTLLLRDDWIDMDQEVVVIDQGQELVRQRVQRTIAAMDASLQTWGDCRPVAYGELDVRVQP